MKKPSKIALWITGVVVVCFGPLGATTLWLRSHTSYAAPNGDLPKHLAGRWDWTSHANQCDDRAHIITFSADRRTMTIAMPRTATDTGWSATYDILDLTPSRVRGAIRGETRMTGRNVPVVWELVMFGPDEYRWHRTDWSSWNYTPGVTRCRESGRVMDDP